MIKESLNKKQLQSAISKKKLYDAAIHLFEEKGYFNTSIIDITSKVGLAKSSFYTHFKTKDEVLIEFFKYSDMQLIEHINSLPIHLSCKEKLYSIIKKSLKMNKEIGISFFEGIFDLRLSESSKIEFFWNNDRPLAVHIRKLIAQGQNSGELRNDLTSDEIYKIIKRSLNGANFEWCMYKGNFDLVESVIKHFSVLYDGLKEK